MPTSLGNLSAPFQGLLAAVGAAQERIGNGHLTSHWPLVGRNFDRGVLVIGQAVYGWIPDWTAGDVATGPGRRAVVIDTANVFADRPDPMDWIDGHRVHNSPFWRTTHEVVDAVAPGDSPWYSRLAWANLYPVAPNDYKGNPEGALREVQTAPAAQFLNAVIATLQPRLVLVLAGPFVWAFVESLGLGELTRTEAPFTLIGHRNGEPWICGMHPGGAQRRGWPARQYAELIIKQATNLGVSTSRD